jgi:hypothetical protein
MMAARTMSDLDFMTGFDDDGADEVPHLELDYGAPRSSPSRPPPRSAPKITPRGPDAGGSRERKPVRRRSVRHVAALALALVASIVGLWLWLRPLRLPDLTVTDGQGQTLHLEDLHQKRDRLLLIFVVPGDTLSPFALGVAKEAYATRSNGIGFAALYIGNQPEADQYRAAHALPFPVYGLRDAPDPFLAQDFMKKAGTSTWLWSRVYGGTSLLVDDQQRVVFRLERDEVRKLRDKLAAIAE